MLRKIVFSSFLFLLLSCDFKDKNGNAPLIDDGTGKLIDNPDYKSDEEYEREELKQMQDNDFKDVGSNMKKWADSVNKLPKTKEESIQHVKTVDMVKKNFNK